MSSYTTETEFHTLAADTESPTETKFSTLATETIFLYRELSKNKNFVV